MWFSPGMVAGGIMVFVVWLMTGTTGQWWMWLAAIGVTLVIDALLGISEHRVPSLPTRSEYHRDGEGE